MDGADGKEVRNRIMIIDHNHQQYRKKWRAAGKNRYNGAFYYSKEIVANIIPNVDTDRNWITVNVPGVGVEHSIVFIHNNLHPENYEWLRKYKDIVLVCGVPETVEKVAHIGKAIYLPLSIDVRYVQRFKVAPDQQDGVAFVGRPAKRRMDGVKLPAGVRLIEGMKRQQLLQEMAKYKQILGVGRVAIEAKALGCEVLPYDSRFPDPDRWAVIDNKEAARILQQKLDEIDHPERCGIPDMLPNMKWTRQRLAEYAAAHRIQVKSKDTKAAIMEKIERASDGE